VIGPAAFKLLLPIIDRECQVLFETNSSKVSYSL
jgi:hypothetical protein